MADGVCKGVQFSVIGRSDQLSLNKFFNPSVDAQLGVPGNSINVTKSAVTLHKVSLWSKMQMECHCFLLAYFQ